MVTRPRPLTGLVQQSYGYRVLTARDAAASALGEVPLAMVRRGSQVHLVLTDFARPDMDGAAPLRQLAPRWPAFAVIYPSDTRQP